MADLVVRRDRDALARPPQRRGEIAALLRRADARGCGVRGHDPVGGPLGVDPVLPLFRRVLDKEPIEERALVDREGPVRLFGVHQAPELAGVTPDLGSIEGELLFALAHDRVLTQRTAEVPHGLVEGLARVRRYRCRARAWPRSGRDDESVGGERAQGRPGGPAASAGPGRPPTHRPRDCGGQRSRRSGARARGEVAWGRGQSWVTTRSFGRNRCGLRCLRNLHLAPLTARRPSRGGTQCPFISESSGRWCCPFF